MTTAASTPEGILVRIKNKVSLELGINSIALKLLIDKYVAIHEAPTRLGTHTEKINRYSIFGTDKMTIKVFFKFLRYIEVRKVKFSVTVRNAHQTTVTAYEEVELSPFDKENDTSTKGVTSDNILVHIKNKLNESLGLTAKQIRILTDEYINSFAYEVGVPKQHERASKYAEFSANKMTIKVFLKYLRVLLINKVTFELTVTNVRGKTVTISEEVYIPTVQKGETDDVE